jgi:hypothetical protein
LENRWKIVGRSLGDRWHALEFPNDLSTISQRSLNDLPTQTLCIPLLRVKVGILGTYYGKLN